MKITLSSKRSCLASSLGLRAFSSSPRGFSLVEVIVVLAILAIISAIGVTSLSNLNKSEALTVEAEKVISLITKARSLTLAAKDGSVYGVHFEERKAVLFTGSTYASGASTNQTQLLNDVVKISAVSLAGGGTKVVFKKLTGSTAQFGTVTVASVASST